jgi:hypothetical protein
MEYDFCTEDELDLNKECKECGGPLCIHPGFEFCPEIEMCEFCDLPLYSHKHCEPCGRKFEKNSNDLL